MKKSSFQSLWSKGANCLKTITQRNMVRNKGTCFRAWMYQQKPSDLQVGRTSLKNIEQLGKVGISSISRRNVTTLTSNFSFFGRVSKHAIVSHVILPSWIPRDLSFERQYEEVFKSTVFFLCFFLQMIWFECSKIRSLRKQQTCQNIWYQGSNYHWIPYRGVSKNRGTPKSSILIGFSLINHPLEGPRILSSTYKWFTLG